MRQDSNIPVMETTTSSESPNTDDYGESPREFGQPDTPQAGGGYYNQLDALPENGDGGGSRRSSTQQTTPAKANWLKKLHAFRWYQLWYALRWKLAVNVFSRPIPVLTANFDVKLGDLIILIPVAGGLTALGAVQLSGLHTKDAGSPASIAVAITFVLSVRNNSLLLALMGLSFERAIFYHKLFGFVAFVTSTMHVLSYFLKHHQVYGSSNLNDDKVFTQDDFDDSNADYFVTGMIAYGPLVLLLLTALYVIRRKFFELFLRFHWLLFIVILVGCLVHGAGIVVVGFAFWAIDAVYRLMYQSRVYKQGTFLKPKTSDSLPEHVGGVQLASPVQQPRGVAAPSQVFVSKLSSDVVCIQLPKIHADTGECFHYEAGQFAFLCVPKLSWLEWHPFSISSAPHEPFVTFHIRALGDWTQKLLALADSATDTKIPSPLSIEMLIDGPYGNVSVDIATPATYSHFALFSGGIGITPMKAIVNQLHFEFQHLDRAEFLQRVHFVWSVRDRGMVQGMVGSEIYATHGHDGNEHEYTSYFPQQLKNGTDGLDSVFSTEIFLTQSERDLEHPLDLALQSNMRYFSRPDVAEILRTIGNDALVHGKKRVAVLACGPAAMIKDVVQTGMKLTSAMGVCFDVHTEKFEF